MRFDFLSYVPTSFLIMIAVIYIYIYYSLFNILSTMFFVYISRYIVALIPIFRQIVAVVYIFRYIVTEISNFRYIVTVVSNLYHIMAVISIFRYIVTAVSNFHHIVAVGYIFRYVVAVISICCYIVMVISNFMGGGGTTVWWGEGRWHRTVFWKYFWFRNSIFFLKKKVASVDFFFQLFFWGRWIFSQIFSSAVDVHLRRVIIYNRRNWKK